MSRIWEDLKQAERMRARKGGTETGSAPSASGSDRRKGLRQKSSVPLLVYGSNVARQPFHEDSETIDVAEGGCLLTLTTVVARGQRLILTNTRNQIEHECKVAHVGKRHRGRARVGVAFRVPSLQFWRS